ncbi:MAG: hypothetical protein KJ043_03400 [Anaerolineae bacterium]|nr:hypothetical protein [Anaerolineae bacterium]
MVYKVSYVIQGGNLPGAIRNETEMPKLGMRVKVGSYIFRVVEVYEMMPPRDGTQFIHVVVASEHDVAFS